MARQEPYEWEGNVGGWIALGAVVLFAVPAVRRGLRTLTVGALVGAWSMAELLQRGRELPSRRLIKETGGWPHAEAAERATVSGERKPPLAITRFENAVLQTGARLKPEAQRDWQEDR